MHFRSVGREQRVHAPRAPRERAPAHEEPRRRPGPHVEKALLRNIMFQAVVLALLREKSNTWLLTITSDNYRNASVPRVVGIGWRNSTSFLHVEILISSFGSLGRFMFIRNFILVH